MTEKPKRPPGRPKGYPRSGGRVKGTPNKSTQLGRDYIIKRGAPIEILCRIARGMKIQAAADTPSKREGIYPTIDQQLAAARILAAKIVPDMKIVVEGDSRVMMVCTKCKAEGLRSTIRYGPSVSTLMSSDNYFDEDGVFHTHDPNTHSIDYTCSNGHTWAVAGRTKCSSCDYGAEGTSGEP